MMQSPSSPNLNSSAPIIRASEIGQYVFCQRAWWLGTVQGYHPVNEAELSAGIQAHLQHGRTVAGSQRWNRVGYALLLLGGMLIALSLCQAIGAGL